MIKDTPHVLFYQALFSLTMLLSVFLGFVVAWLLFNQPAKFQKRPGINIKEL